MFQGPFPAEEMGGAGGDEADDMCWFAALLAKTVIDIVWTIWHKIQQGSC